MNNPSHHGLQLNPNNVDTVESLDVIPSSANISQKTGVDAADELKKTA